MSNRFKEILFSEGFPGMTRSGVKNLLDRQRKSAVPKKILRSVRRMFVADLKEKLADREEHQIDRVLSGAFGGDGITTEDTNYLLRKLDGLERPLGTASYKGDSVLITIVDFSTGAKN